MARTEEKRGMENAVEKSAMRKIYLRLLPFAVLIVLLYLTGREVILAHRQIKS